MKSFQERYFLGSRVPGIQTQRNDAELTLTRYLGSKSISKLLNLNAGGILFIMDEQDDKISALSSLLREFSPLNDRCEWMFLQEWGSTHQARPIFSIGDRLALNHQHSGRKTGLFTDKQFPVDENYTLKDLLQNKGLKLFN